METLQNIQNKINETKGSWDDYNDQYKDGKNYLLEYAKQNNVLESSVDDVKKANQAARDSALAHNEAIKAQTFSAKVGNVALQALAEAGNKIAFAVINKGIELVIKGFDNWIHRVEKANEAMKDAVNEYESAKSSLESVNSELEEQNKKLDELLSKDKLTYVEKGQLKELQDITKELSLQQDAEERRARLASKEAADKTVNAYKKQYGGYDKTEDELNEKISANDFPIPESSNDVLGVIAAYVRYEELLKRAQENYQNALINGENTVGFEMDIQLYTNSLKSYSDEFDRIIPDLVEKRSNLIEEYNNAIKKRKTEPLSTSEIEIIEAYESINDLIKMAYEYTDPNTWKSMQIASVFNTEGVEKTKEELVEMVKAGTLDERTLQSYPKLSEALKQNEVSASELLNELEALAEAEKNVIGDTFNDKTLADKSSKLSSMSDQISSMAEALGTKLEDGFVSVDTLSGFDVEVRGLDSWDRFQELLGSTTSSYKECEEAANALATEWVNSNDFLAQLTEQNKEYYKTQLESMGIENYEEVIDSILALKKAKEAIADVDLVDATYEDIEALISEAEYSELVKEQIWSLYAAKLAGQTSSIDSSADCQQFLNLANHANLTAESMRLLTELMKIYNGLESGVYSERGRDREYAYERIAQIKAELDELAEGEELFVEQQIKFRLNGNSKKPDSGSNSSKDTHKEKYEKELQELEHAHDMGLISDAEYWKARIDLNEKYFGESSGMHQKYLDEYRDAEEAILSGIKDLWKDYYDQRKSELKDLISYAQELYDKEIDSLDASIEKLEERRDTEKMYWQNQIDDLGDEIDALQDANDEKQRAIDLQNKQYQLQKAMHQRTMLIYSESQGLHYVTDDRAVRDAKNDLDDAENDSKIEGLKKQQKDLQKQLDTILETYDSQIDSIEKQIDSLNKVKSAWSEIVNNQELKELEERLKSIFGDDVKEKILSDNTDYINGIISQYSDTSEILKTIEDATLTDIQNMVSQYGVLPENLMYALTDMSSILKNYDTSGLNSNLDNTAQSLSNVTEKIQSENSALNNLSDDISNYQIPAVNTDNFTASFAEDSDIMITINGFAERFKEICANLANIWNTSFSDLGSRLGNFHVASVNAYASGTKRAKKGIAVVGEEKPEVVVTNNKKVLLAEHPTLLNMEGGETVFDGDETEKMLKARGLRRITPDELPLLKALTQYNSSEITQRFTPNITSPANAILSSTMQNASHAVTNNSAIQPSYTMGDVHIHCPGITKDEVVKQIGTELTNVFNGMSLKAYQRANITR